MHPSIREIEVQIGLCVSGLVLWLEEDLDLRDAVTERCGIALQRDRCAPDRMPHRRWCEPRSVDGVERRDERVAIGSCGLQSDDAREKDHVRLSRIESLPGGRDQDLEANPLRAGQTSDIDRSGVIRGDRVAGDGEDQVAKPVFGQRRDLGQLALGVPDASYEDCQHENRAKAEKDS